MFFEIGFIHSDTIILDGDCALFVIKGYINTRAKGETFKLLIAQSEIRELIERVRGVAHKLAQKDFFVGIQRMYHQIQKLCDLCLKRMLSSHTILLVLRKFGRIVAEKTKKILIFIDLYSINFILLL